MFIKKHVTSEASPSLVHTERGTGLLDTVSGLGLDLSPIILWEGLRRH